jgi:rod shape-determining protein MreD
MKIFSIIFYIIILLFVQIGILPHLVILGAYPNLILLSIISLSILRGWKKMLSWIVGGGLFMDFYSLHNILGVSVTILLITAYISYFLSQNTFKKATFLSLSLVFLITIIAYGISLIVFSEVLGIGLHFGFLNFISEIIYNLIFAIPVFYLTKKYARFGKI